jgi:Apea-like HEPN
MCASSAPNQSFPRLSKLLGNLRSGLKQFGLSEIEDLLRGRNDRDFRKKAAQKSQLLQDAVREIQIKCIDLTYSPDPGHIKFLLWQPVSKLYWDAEKVGHYIVRQLRAPEQERFVCIPLYGSVAPWRKEPTLHQLSHGIWLIEPPRTVDRLLGHLTALLGDFPSGIEAELRKIEDPLESEFAALLSEPLLACRKSGRFSQREHGLWLYAVPLIALHNMVIVNSLDTTENLSHVYYMMGLAPPAWREELRREWECANDDPIALENGITEPHQIVSIADPSRKICAYEFHLKDGTISPVHWSSQPLANRPPLLILPSVLDESNTNRFVEYGVQISEIPQTYLDRRIAHAVLMWTKASGFMQQWDWEGGFEERGWTPDILDPDSLTLYSTIVLESLFSSESNKQEVTTRIADLTAALLAGSGNDRYELSKKIRKLYGLRSDFVHGSIDRPAQYSQDAARLFKIATLALWEVVKLRTALHPPFSKWKDLKNMLSRESSGQKKEMRIKTR